ncbi:BglG family transcription antiterminator LicT [Terrisporobacter vanillatitrophus]|uniref:BglG family transcription antiterminator LicT n=1 Tax=Terrisporobacter vanillatitrophus TaxID=3058402 RepID=UPI0033687A2E
MIIEKILNNNVILTKNEKDEEVVAMGKGIAFKKKIGDIVPKESIDKVYTLSDKDTLSKFQQLIADIPMEYMTLTDDIISYAKLSLGKKLNDKIYIALTDHIHTAIERFKEGVAVKNAVLWDTRRFYKEEFAIGMKSLDLIEKRFNVRLPDDEAGFIALHIVNAEKDQDIKVVYKITKIMQEVSNIVKYYFGVSFDEESVYYYRFITHLKFFAERLLNGKSYTGEEDDGLLDVIKVKYKNSYECVEKISSFIEEKYNYVLANEEKLYLTIHIEKVVSRA